MKKIKKAVPGQPQQTKTGERRARLIREITTAQLDSVKGGGLEPIFCCRGMGV